MFKFQFSSVVSWDENDVRHSNHNSSIQRVVDFVLNFDFEKFQNPIIVIKIGHGQIEEPIFETTTDLEKFVVDFMEEEVTKPKLRICRVLWKAKKKHFCCSPFNTIRLKYLAWKFYRTYDEVILDEFRNKLIRNVDKNIRKLFCEHLKTCKNIKNTSK